MNKEGFEQSLEKWLGLEKIETGMQLGFTVGMRYAVYQRNAKCTGELEDSVFTGMIMDEIGKVGWDLVHVGVWMPGHSI